MKLAMAQINTTVGDIDGNRDRVVRTMERTRSLGADLVVFPELCLTGYPPRDLLGIHDFVDANLRALRDVAQQSGEVAAVVGFVDRNERVEGRGFYNAAAFVSAGQVRHVYHKHLLPTYDVFDEDRYFDRGQDSRPVSFKGRRIGLSVCEDAWNAQDFWPRRLYSMDPIQAEAQQGADLLINISASPFEMHKPELRLKMLSDHVKQHRIPLAYLNLVGGNDDILFDGNSLVLGRDGNVIAHGAAFTEDLFIVDPDSAADVGYSSPPPMAQLFQALAMGTRDYAAKCGFRTAVLGLSGGIDSAVTACIAAEALGAERVFGVAMPSRYSARESCEDARTLAADLGISFQVVPIEDVFSAYSATLADAFHDLAPDTTEENLQARIRGNILMALSNKFGHLVLSTGNKSELGVGYCTLYGDMAGGLAVISDVPKTVVYQLAAYINRDQLIIPENTIRRPPTAELRPNQTDQDTLPDYAVLDGILKLRVEEQMSIDEIVVRGYDPDLVRSVVRRIHLSEYKRRQAAPGLKVTTRAFGTGRRMPIAMRLRF